MKKIIYFTVLLGTISFSLAAEKKSEATLSGKEKVRPKEEVLENPTLKTLSGALSPWSFRSSFTYKGGSLSDPTNAERPNITNASEKPSLQSLSGNLGVKYRMTKSDNLSLEVGMYMATPFHSSHTSDNSRVQEEFDNNHQELDIDDPKVSYFKTYYLGKFQNVSFVTFEKTTRGVLTDRGYWGNLSLSHATAYRLHKSIYVAGTFAALQYFFDKGFTVNPKTGRNVSLRPYQTERVYKLSLSMEYYPVKNWAIRLISDIGTYYQMRESDFDDLERRDLQQTLAATYFITRDISIAPSLQFVAEDIRSEKINVGTSININI